MSAQVETSVGGRISRRAGLSFTRLPYWLIILLVFFVITFYAILTSQTYSDALTFIIEGLQLTVLIALTGYAVALVTGLIIGLGRIAHNQIIYTLATLYVEIMRGVPLLVIIFYARFVIVPWLDNMLGFNNTLLRNQLIIGAAPLALGYAAYLAEVYRAGIESIERGQMEAARSLGLNHFQAMRYIILPQAIKRVLPPLGNDFIAMLKDTALLSSIGVLELTYWGKAKIAVSANTFLGWNTVAFLYLILSLLLSLAVKWIEGRVNSGNR